MSRARNEADGLLHEFSLLRFTPERSLPTGRPASVRAPGDRWDAFGGRKAQRRSAAMETSHRMGGIAARGKVFLLLLACACGSVATGPPEGSGATQDPSSPVSY